MFGWIQPLLWCYNFASKTLDYPTRVKWLIKKIKIKIPSTTILSHVVISWLKKKARLNYLICCLNFFSFIFILLLWSTRQKKKVILSDLIYFDPSQLLNTCFILKFSLPLVLMAFYVLSPFTPVNIHFIFPPIVTPAIFIFLMAVLPKI